MFYKCIFKIINRIVYQVIVLSYFFYIYSIFTSGIFYDILVCIKNITNIIG